MRIGMMAMMSMMAMISPGRLLPRRMTIIPTMMTIEITMVVGARVEAGLRP